ncbi:armadillo-type protein [Mycena leptocephala]|nr:armadillo-type protein [Mycena leptocephala]
MSIHAAAKPLIRLMYHEQVRGFIKRNRSTPLSRDTLEICFSYLGYKYISPATKTLILKDLDVRLEIKEDAGVMVDSLMAQWDLLRTLLGSSDARIRQYTCASNIFFSMTRIAQSDEDTEVRESALSAIVKISESPGGAQAISDIKMWEVFPELLDPSNAIMYRFTRSILGNLAVYQVTLLRVANSSDIDPEVRRCAIYVLSQISCLPEGAQAVAEAKALDYVTELLDSSDIETRTWTCEMLGNMVFRGSMSHGVMLCTEIVLLLSDQDSYVRDVAMLVLSRLSHSPDYVGVVTHSTILKDFAEILDSSDPVIRLYTCSVLGDLALDQSASLINMSSELCVRIARLLSDTDMEVRRCSLWTLSQMSRLTGAAWAVEAQMMQDLPEHLSDIDTVWWTCEMLGNLAIHKSSSVVQPDVDLWARIVTHLSDEHERIRHAAIHAISKISRTFRGARAIGDTMILEHVPRLLDIDNTRLLTLKALSNLAFHRALPNLSEMLRERLTSFLRCLQRFFHPRGIITDGTLK